MNVMFYDDHDAIYMRYVNLSHPTLPKVGLVQYGLEQF